MLKPNPARSQELVERIRGLDSDKRQQLFRKLHQAGVNVARLPIVPAAERGSVAMSYAQQRQWFLWQLDPDSAAYHISLALRLRGALDTAALERAFSTLVARHEPLRTRFIEQDGQALQVIEPTGTLQLTHAHLRLEGSAQQQDAQVRTCVEQEVTHLFDLQHGPLLRVKRVQLAPDDHLLILTQHHIVSDGWSMQLMVEELIQLYGGYSQGRAVELPALPIQYADYALWQRQWMESGERERQLAYWTAQLGGEQAVIALPTDHPRPPVQSYRGAQLTLQVPVELCQALKALAQAQDVSLFMVLLASFQALLHRYSGQADIRVGVPNANRNRVETERLIGFFVNTQVMKAAFDSDIGFDQLLQQVKRAALEAQAHQDLPFEQLVEALQPQRTLSHSPLFQVMFNHQGQSPQRAAVQQVGDLQLQALDSDSLDAQFDLSLDTHETGGQLQAVFAYATDLFEPATIERMAAHWQHLLQALVDDVQQRVIEAPLLGREERTTLLEDWGHAPAEYPSERCVHALFEGCAERTPDAPALLCEGEQLSYRQLDQRANRLARKLVGLGVGPEVLVGIALERGLDMVVGLLAVLKAGGGYVPLDPQYPRDRLLCMIEDSGSQLLLSQRSLRDALPVPQGVAVLCLDSDEAWTEQDASRVQSAVQPDNLAYVMFTSGSTGRPKGVGISHRSLTRHAHVSLGFFGLSAADRVLQFATFNFDGFVEQLYPALICGASVVLRGNEIWDSETFYRQLIEQQISVVDLTTAYWNMLAKEFAAVGPRDYGVLRQVHSGGEAMPPEGLLAWREAGLGGVRLLNTYGPTEATVTATTLDCDDYVAGSRPIPLTLPIGKVLPGRSIHVLDDSGALAPIGVVGELVIGGDLLARGYFQRPGLSAERFLPDPFGASGARLYRTGDLARFNAEGVIEYVGRIDHQVKIRGFRIELGEIEARLLEQPGVRDATVQAVPGGNGLQLVGYVVPAEAGATAGELRERLRSALQDCLPDYMVPSQWVLLDALPLSPNGKLDRKALPAPDISQSLKTYVAPNSPREQQVAAIWQAVLNVEQVGLSDNFFELGGHSLLATQVISRVRQVVQVEVNLRDLFEHPELGAFCAALAGPLQAPQLAFERADRTRPLALSSAQERQWFLWQLDPQSAAYHVPIALRLHGPLDVPALQRSFDTLVARHEALRTTFVQQPEQLVQVIADSAHLALDLTPLRAGQDLEACVEQEIVRPFDLRNGPLLRVRLLALGEQEHVLVVTQHHIVSDAWSMQLVVRELIAHYAAFSQGQAVQPAPLALQYADYAHWQRQWMRSEAREQQLAYWCTRLAGAESALALPADYPRPAQMSHRGAQLEVQLPVALSTALKQLAQREQVTLFMLLLASFQVLLHRYSGQTDIRVGVPIANRNRVETEHLVGFFVNTLVLQVDVDAHAPFEQLLHQCKTTVLDAHAHQDLPFEQLVEALQPERSLSHNPLFQVMFNHQFGDPRGARLGDLGALQVEALAWDSVTAQVDLTLDTFETADGLSATLTYATDLFQASTIERLGRHWRNLLQALVDPRQRISELPMLDAAELQDLKRWSAEGRHYPVERSIHQLIQQQAERRPDATALLCAGQQMSFATLERRANQLAHCLIEAGVGPEHLVGIAVERGLDVVVGLLAILKAGAAYVPLDLDYPRERLAYLMQDAGIGLLLTESHLIERLPLPAGVACLALDQLALAQQSNQPPAVQVQPGNLAYVIYTSGSTGQPKGVAVAHGPLVMHCQAIGERYEMVEQDCELHFMSFAFDGAHERWLTALSHGARLLIRDGQLWTPEQTYQAMHQHGVTVAAFPPVYLQQLAEHAERDGNPPPVRVYCFGGDAVPQASYELARRALRPRYIINGYGPTETVVTPLIWKAAEGDHCDAAYAPIGSRIGDRSARVLDDTLQAVPLGHAGELYLGGEGLARGYLNRPGLTAERFVPDPFARGGARTYRSGDLVRQRVDGTVDYLSRIDHQVKVRGFRIELGEVEACLQSHPVVREAVVIAQQGPNGAQLVGYVVVAASARAAGEEHLRDQLNLHLKANLPGYMIPSYLLCVERFALTPNGKLDRKALPRADASAMQRTFVAPQGALEQQIAGIWQQVLKVEQVGRNDNFFELGGHSLLATQATAQVQLQLGADIALDLVFKAATLHEYSTAVEGCLNGNLEQDLSDMHEFLNELETL